MHQGSQLVDMASRTMTEIVSSVTRVNDIMGEIASASDEQRRGIEQVAQAVSQMDSSDAAKRRAGGRSRIRHRTTRDTGR